MKKMKKSKRKKENKSKLKIKTSIRLSFFSSLSTPARLVIMDIVLQSVSRFFY